MPRLGPIRDFLGLIVGHGLAATSNLRRPITVMRGPLRPNVVWPGYDATSWFHWRFDLRFTVTHRYSAMWCIDVSSLLKAGDNHTTYKYSQYDNTYKIVVIILKIRLTIIIRTVIAIKFNSKRTRWQTTQHSFTEPNHLQTLSKMQKKTAAPWQ